MAAQNLAVCAQCDRDFCQTCSEAEDPDTFCSKKCERDYDTELKESDPDNA